MIPDLTQHLQEVRGCQFANTVYRELYFQGLVNKILEDNGLVGANTPLGLWAYAAFDEELQWSFLS